MSARELLAHVLAEARETLNLSPEQVGKAVRVSGRTVRRLEDAEHEARPRTSTLGLICSFYGLDTSFITELAEWERGDGALESWLVSRAGGCAGEFDRSEEGVRQLALMLARGGGVREGHEPELALSGAMLSYSGGKTHAFALAGARQLRLALGDDASEYEELLESFARLDRRRRRLLLSLASEMLRAREAERGAG